MTGDIAPLGFAIDSTSALKAVKDLRALDVAAGKTEAQAQRISRAWAGLEKSKFLKSAATGMAEYSREVDGLQSSFSTIIGAQAKFDADIARINAALAKGVLTMDQANYAARQLGAANLEAANGMNVYSRSSTQANMHTANVFAQLNDISVMMASGQNPLVLAMQQGTQLNQVWGQMGGGIKNVGSALAGALTSMINPMSLLTIGVIAGGAALVQWGMSAMGAEEKARTLDDAMGDVSTGISAYNGYITTALMTTAELTEKFGGFSEQIKGFSIYMAGLSLGDTITAFNEQSTMLKEGLGGIEQALANVAMAQTQLNGISKDQDPTAWLMANDALDLFQGNLDEAAAKLGILPSQAQGLADVLSGIKTDGTMADLAASSATALRYIERIAPNAMQIKGPLNDAYTALYKVQTTAAEASKKTQELAASAPGGEWMNPAIGGVDTLIGRVEAALGRVAALRSAAMSGLASQYQQYGEGRVAGENLSRESGSLYGGTGNVLTGTGWYDKKGGGGGGGGAKDPYSDNLTRLIESLRTEKETVDAWYNENLTLLNDRRAQEILGESAHKDALLDLEREYLEKKKGINDGYGQFSLESAGQLFGELHSLSGSKYDGLLKLQKGFAAASAMINAYTAASQALASPEVPFFAKFAAVTKVLATGMGLVNAIKGGGSGGSSGGSASATTSATKPTQAEPNRVTRVELQGEDWLVSLAESMMTQIYDASKNGRVIVARA